MLIRSRGGWAFLPAVCSAACLGLAAEARDARADSCTMPDLVETIPADMATGVPLNASLFARYQTNAQYLGEAVTLDEEASGASGAPTVVAAAVSFDASEGLLQLTPDAPLDPATAYVVHWPALRGIDTATLGTSADLHFTTGSSADVSPPTFAGITSVSWDVSRDTDSCTNQVEERYVFDLGLGAAADDGGRDALTLVVFQTSGPGVDSSAPLPVLVQRLPPAGQGVTVTSTDLVGHVCFAAIVQDLTAKASTSGAPVCVDTVAPPFFYGCGISRGRRPGGGAALLAAAALLALAGRRTRAGRHVGSRARCPSRREGAG